MTLDNLKQDNEGKYYVGNMIDGMGFVDMETAELILLEYNNGVREC